MQLLRKLVMAAGALALAAGIAHAQTPKKGGTLNFAVVAEPPTLDCHGVSTFAFAHPGRPHYSTLLKFSGQYDVMKIVGDLAESWEMSPDGLSYTFKLFKGVKFHDGAEMTSGTSRQAMSASSTRRKASFRCGALPMPTSAASRRPIPTRSSSR
jgi:peptide/nickel transport system substrate-binding protein